MKWYKTLIASIIPAATLLPCPVAAQEGAAAYPAKPVRVIVSYAPGGATDVLTRLVAQKLSETTGKSFVVDNRSGASGIPGDTMAAKATPDGYTLLGTSSTFTINPALIAKLPFDPIKDFTPITMVAQASFLLVVSSSVPVKSVKELIAYAKANPGKLNYGSAGQGTVIHLAHELFNTMAGVKMTHIPYKGGGPAMIGLLSGEVALVFTTAMSALPHISAGKLRALGVSSDHRSSILPEIPTIAEAGVPGYEVASWYGWIAPARTPPLVINKLHAEIVKIVKSPDIIARLASQGTEPVGNTPQEFRKYMAAAIPRWRSVVKEAGITLAE